MDVSDVILFMLQQGKCFYCSCVMDVITHPQTAAGYTRDHFYASCRGNGLTGNKVLAHHHCNNHVKGSKDPTQEEILRFKQLTLDVEAYIKELTHTNRTIKKK